MDTDTTLSSSNIISVMNQNLIDLPESFINKTQKYDTHTFSIFSWTDTHMTMLIRIKTQYFLPLHSNFLNSTVANIKKPYRADFGKDKLFLFVLKNEDTVNLPVSVPLFDSSYSYYIPYQISYYQNNTADLTIADQIEDFNYFSPNDVYWKERNEIVMPFVPFFSNCKNYGQYLNFYELTDYSENDCNYVSVEDTYAINPIVFADEPYSDTCDNVQIQCVYDDLKVYTDPDNSRWFETTIDTVLFYITKLPQDLNFTTLSTEEYPYDETELIEVTQTSSVPENQIPKTVNFTVNYYQFDPTYKKVITAEVVLDVFAELTTEQQLGTEQVEYNLNFKFHSMTHSELVIAFALKLPVYFILFVSTAAFSIMEAVIFFMYHWVVNRIRPKPKFLFWIYIKPLYLDQLIGFILVVIPIAVIFTIMSIVQIGSLADIELNLFGDCQDTESDYCKKSIFDFFTNGYTTSDDEFVTQRAGRVGTALTVFGVQIMYMTSKLLIPDKKQKNTVKLANDNFFGGNTNQEVQWERMNFIFTSLAMTVYYTLMIALTFSNLYAQYMWYILPILKIIQIMIDQLLGHVLVKDILKAPNNILLGVLIALATMEDYSWVDSDYNEQDDIDEQKERNLRKINSDSGRDKQQSSRNNLDDQYKKSQNTENDKGDKKKKKKRYRKKADNDMTDDGNDIILSDEFYESQHDSDDISLYEEQIKSTNKNLFASKKTKDKNKYGAKKIDNNHEFILLPSQLQDYDDIISDIDLEDDYQEKLLKIYIKKMIKQKQQFQKENNNKVEQTKKQQNNHLLQNDPNSSIGKFAERKKSWKANEGYDGKDQIEYNLQDLYVWCFSSQYYVVTMSFILAMLMVNTGLFTFIYNSYNPFNDNATFGIWQIKDNNKKSLAYIVVEENALLGEQNKKEITLQEIQEFMTLPKGPAYLRAKDLKEKENEIKREKTKIQLSEQIKVLSQLNENQANNIMKKQEKENKRRQEKKSEIQKKKNFQQQKWEQALTYREKVGKLEDLNRNMKKTLFQDPKFRGKFLAINKQWIKDNIKFVLNPAFGKFDSVQSELNSIEQIQEQKKQLKELDDLKITPKEYLERKKQTEKQKKFLQQKEYREQILLQFEGIFGLLENHKKANLENIENNDEIQMDNLQEVKNEIGVFHKAQKINKNGKHILIYWLNRSKQLIQIQSYVGGLIEAHTSSYCCFCGSNFGLRAEIENTTIEDIYLQFIKDTGYQRNQLNNWKSIQEWQNYFLENAKFRTSCFQCSSQALEYQLKMLQHEKNQENQYHFDYNSQEIQENNSMLDDSYISEAISENISQGFQGQSMENQVIQEETSDGSFYDTPRQISSKNKPHKKLNLSSLKNTKTLQSMNGSQKTDQQQLVQSRHSIISRYNSKKQSLLKTLESERKKSQRGNTNQSIQPQSQVGSYMKKSQISRSSKQFNFDEKSIENMSKRNLKQQMLNSNKSIQELQDKLSKQNSQNLLQSMELKKLQSSQQSLNQLQLSEKSSNQEDKQLLFSRPFNNENVQKQQSINNNYYLKGQSKQQEQNFNNLQANTQISQDFQIQPLIISPINQATNLLSPSNQKLLANEKQLDNTVLNSQIENDTQIQSSNNFLLNDSKQLENIQNK
ncbi:hypothetical protein PPERSA_12041 [Pseudocohnilembus persalinus]|uniref:Transmembrane protein n=1 Tax=Pseudocohnilembus persalinus TaxID=266149 RepID=A0A0V0R9I8_PSEPJ|nr:hypothetical protein PPERSA_12041 [Pseudocohnilembus persalinus]|eukprot:KRX10917.1 hypothetical protein PPERSA_12041 [Pseudocohnilembus persalinus]